MSKFFIIFRHLVKIMPALIGALAAAADSPQEAEQLSYAQAVVLSVSDDEDDTGLSCIMDEFLSVCGQSDDIGKTKKTTSSVSKK